MKRFNLMIFFVSIFFTACGLRHEVNLEGLSSERNQTFHVRSVEINCHRIDEMLGGVYNKDWLCLGDCQFAILNNIPLDDIKRILSTSYGIKTAGEDRLSIYSYNIDRPNQEQERVHYLPATQISMNKVKVSFHLEDLLGTSDKSTCFFLKDSAASNYTHYIDIKFTAWHESILNTKIVLVYDIAVQASAHPNGLITHRDIIEAIDYNSQTNEMIDKMRAAAAKIPSALERDIKAYQSSSKP